MKNSIQICPSKAGSVSLVGCFRKYKIDGLFNDVHQNFLVLV